MGVWAVAKNTTTLCDADVAQLLRTRRFQPIASTMNASSATNQLASHLRLKRSPHIVGLRVHSSAHCRTVLKHQQHLPPSLAVLLPELHASVTQCDPVQNSVVLQHCAADSIDATPCYRVYSTVKPTDVDMYGVVTNTMYHEYMYKARAALGASTGLSMEVLMERYGIMMATTSFTINYKSPLQCGDNFFAESVPCEVRGATFKFKECVVRVSSTGEQQVVAEGLATCVTLLPGCPPVKPVRIPAPMREALLKCIAANNEAAAGN